MVLILEDRKKIENKIKLDMKKLGVFKPEYREMIQILSGMLHQYQHFENEFANNGYNLTEEYTNKAGATNERKTPLYTALESLRKDIATYSDRLCLNPKALDAVTTDKTGKSKLASALAKRR